MGRPKTEQGRLLRLQRCVADGMDITTPLRDVYRVFAFGQRPLLEQPREVMYGVLKETLMAQGKAERSAADMAHSLEGYLWKRVARAHGEEFDNVSLGIKLGRLSGVPDSVFIDQPQSTEVIAQNAAQEALDREIESLGSDLGIQNLRCG